MRIQQHLSIILLVAVVGAIALAVIVGMLLGGVEKAARRLENASIQQRQMNLVVAQARALGAAVTDLGTRSSDENFVVVEQAIEQSFVHLARMRLVPLMFDAKTVDRAWQLLDRTRTLAAGRSSGVQHPDDIEQLRQSVDVYLRSVDEAGLAAATTVSHHAVSVTRRRRLMMLMIGLSCMVFLAAIERVRQWTTRKLVDPLQRLSEAARCAIHGGGAVPSLNHGDTEELKSLAQMLSSFADTINENVSKRTAQIVRQKESLELEVRVRRRAEDELRFAALRDKVTGLCNRELLVDRVAGCFERARRRKGFDFVLMFIDVDQYSEVVDRFGRGAGDQLLVTVADRLKSSIAQHAEPAGVEQWTLSRLGGDEFAVLLEAISRRSDASQFAERLHQNTATPIRLEGREIRVTASVGIAFPEKGIASAGDLLRNADTARYFAKAGGAGRTIVFKPGMHDQVGKNEEKGNRLRQGIERGEFQIVYQPIVSVATGRLHGFEALARWNDPERGAVSPVEFIPDAEESGAIVELGQWMLDQACGQLTTWREKIRLSRELTISVNVSRQQLNHPDFITQVQQALDESGIGASSLKLEITESVIMEDPDAVAESLGRLRAIGVEIHMDDFGTGYSSLSYLHRLPIDVLKIDRAFMSTMKQDSSYAEVVHTIVALARTMQMKVTVEGVESEDQLTQLQALGCDHMQGYYFSEPLDSKAAGRLIDENPRWMGKAA